MFIVSPQAAHTRTVSLQESNTQGIQQQRGDKHKAIMTPQHIVFPFIL